MAKISIPLSIVTPSIERESQQIYDNLTKRAWGILNLFSVVRHSLHYTTIFFRQQWRNEQKSSLNCIIELKPHALLECNVCARAAAWFLNNDRIWSYLEFFSHKKKRDCIILSTLPIKIYKTHTRYGLCFCCLIYFIATVISH